MLIQIKHVDSRYDYVKDTMLDQLIEAGEISSFRRSTGWVTVGVDPIRKEKRHRNSQWTDDLRELVL